MDNRHKQIKAWAKANVNSKNKNTAGIAKILMDRNNYTYGGLAAENITNTKLVGRQTHIRTNAYDKTKGQGMGVGLHIVFDANDNLKSVKRSRKTKK